MMEIKLNRLNKVKLTVDKEIMEIPHIKTEPDPNWKFTDGKGHVHKFKGSRLSSLMWMEGDDEIEGWWECPKCGEEIFPRYIRTVEVSSVEGLTTWSGSFYYDSTLVAPFKTGEKVKVVIDTSSDCDFEGEIYITRFSGSTNDATMEYSFQGAGELKTIAREK